MRKIILVHPFSVFFQAFMIFADFRVHTTPAVSVFFLAWGAFCTGIYWDDVCEAVKP